MDSACFGTARLARTPSSIGEIARVLCSNVTELDPLSPLSHRPAGVHPISAVVRFLPFFSTAERLPLFAIASQADKNARRRVRLFKYTDFFPDGHLRPGDSDLVNSVL